MMDKSKLLRFHVEEHEVLLFLMTLLVETHHPSLGAYRLIGLETIRSTFESQSLFFQEDNENNKVSFFRRTMKIEKL